MGVFSTDSFDNHESVSFFSDADTGLRAIIAVHSSRLGAAVGGCRMYPYSSEGAAIDDVLRLSRGMSYKSALAGLPMGGGKAVIIGDPSADKTPALLRAFGDCVERLGGRYITAEDSGTTVADMACIAERTRFVSGLNAGPSRHGGDPSPYTAYGVFRGIQQAWRVKKGETATLAGCRVLVQGAGAVGRHLIALLIAEGAQVMAADINADNLQKSVAMGASAIAQDEVFSVATDIFAPCAMGSVFTTANVMSIQAEVIAGAANNQLEGPEVAKILARRGILYAPDFAINAGGIIDVYYQRSGGEHRQVISHIERTVSVLEQILRRAQCEQRDTHSVAEEMAEQRLLQGGEGPLKTAASGSLHQVGM